MAIDKITKENWRSFSNLTDRDLRGIDFEGVDLEGVSFEGSDFRGANLKGTNLQFSCLNFVKFDGADLTETNLAYSELISASLHGVNLRGASLRNVNMYGIDLQNADCENADLGCVILRGANLKGTNFKCANMDGADLFWADLEGANFTNACLRTANLESARNVPDHVADMFDTVTKEGEFVAWKKCRGGMVVKIKILEGTKRSNATSNKCRAESAEVLEIKDYGSDYGYIHHKPLSIARSTFNHTFVYRVGETVHCKEWNDDRWVECGGGIHFFMSEKEAKNYY